MNQQIKKRGRPPRAKNDLPTDVEPPNKWRCLPAAMTSLRHTTPEKHGPNLPRDSKVESILDVSIDEGLVCFKGRYHNRVHIRGKPDPTGLKIYSLADGLGYLWSFWQYDGEKSTVTEIVNDFMDKLPSRHYKLYADSWYGSDKLALELHQKGMSFTLGCGKNKPADVFNNYLDVGLVADQTRYLQHDDYPTLLAVSYFDRAKCHFLTNFHRPDNVTNRRGDTIPGVAQDYRLHMGSVDKVNRTAAKVTWPHKNFRWTMCFFWYALALCVCNARTFYTAYFKTKYKIMDFTGHLIAEWIETLPTKILAPHFHRHTLQILPSRGRCALCKHINRNIGKTNHWCTDCKCYLHPDCSNNFHSQ